MKRLSLAIIFMCCMLALAAQNVIRVNYQGSSPTISDFAWAFLSSSDDEEEEDCVDESFNAIKQAWIRHRKGLPQEEGDYSAGQFDGLTFYRYDNATKKMSPCSDIGFDVVYGTDDGAWVSYALPRTGKDITVTSWYKSGKKQKMLKWKGRRFCY